MALRQITRSPAQRASAARAEAREAREEQARADRYAASFGPCATCLVDVGEDGVHAWSCTSVSTVRRANRGRAPEPEPFDLDPDENAIDDRDCA